VLWASTTCEVIRLSDWLRPHVGKLALKVGERRSLSGELNDRKRVLTETAKQLAERVVLCPAGRF
jgi:hypothetical protein